MSHPEVTASSTQPVPKVIELPGAPPFREWHIECPIHGPQTVRTYMRNVVRAARTELVSQGLLSFRQENGEKRYYRVHLNLLPPSKIAGFRSEPGDEVTPVQKCTGFRSEPGSEVNRDRVQK